MFEQATLLQQLGNPYTNRVVDRLHQFAYIPDVVIENLANESLTEEWGNNNYVLKKYLAVHIPWSIEQGCYTHSDNQFYVTAGNLQTRYGTPLYLAFQESNGDQPWRIVASGANVRAVELPAAPDIPALPQLVPGSEIVMRHDHILGDNAERVPFLADTPPVAQMCAVAGATQWSLNRDLKLPYWYYGKMNYVVPLYLADRENIARAPDAIAPIQVSPNNLLVRTVLAPHMPYASARVSVMRHDQLPPWLLDAWAEHSANVEEDDQRDEEAAGEQPDAVEAPQGEVANA